MTQKNEQPLYSQMMDILLELTDIPHHYSLSDKEKKKKRSQVLKMIDEMIGSGNEQLYVAKALLSSSKDWYYGEITDLDHFKAVLKEGIDKGCLAPDKSIAWEWMNVAATNNDPQYFMDDMDLYYDLLACAAENGEDYALDIMDMIWEPEQIIEED